jgi:hypothetical protein
MRTAFEERSTSGSLLKWEKGRAPMVPRRCRQGQEFHYGRAGVCGNRENAEGEEGQEECPAHQAEGAGPAARAGARVPEQQQKAAEEGPRPAAPASK